MVRNKIQDLNNYPYFENKIMGGNKVKITAGEWLQLSLMQKHYLLKNNTKKEQ